MKTLINIYNIYRILGKRGATISFPKIILTHHPIYFDKYKLFLVGEGSDACEAVVNDDTVRRQSRRGTEHRSARPLRPPVRYRKFDKQ